MAYNENDTGRARDIAETLEAVAGITWAGEENLNMSGYLKRIQAASEALPRFLVLTGEPTSHTGDTAETVLGSVTIPANSMGPRGRVMIHVLLRYPSSASGKHIRIKFGGVVFRYTIPTTTQCIETLTFVVNRGATNSQVGPPSGQALINQMTNAAPITAAVDTTQDVVVEVTGALVDSLETIYLDYFAVEVAYGA